MGLLVLANWNDVEIFVGITLKLEIVMAESPICG